MALTTVQLFSQARKRVRRFLSRPSCLPRLVCLLWCFGGLVFSSHATLQFDVFIGYDGTVHEADWFPVACEVLNDGPPFNAVFELFNEGGGRNQSRQMIIELPTNTRKRFVLPVFASAGRSSRWSARLMDEKGKVRAERDGLVARDRAWDSPLIGAVPRTFGGLPDFPKITARQEEFQPLVARLQVDYFPDTPFALEGLDALYLNSERALDLKDNQVTALLAWLNGGGHLILGVEQPVDVNGNLWLRQLLPCTLNDVVTKPIKGEIQKWLRGENIEPTPELPSSNTAAQPVPTVDPRINLDPQMARRYGLRPGALRSDGRGRMMSPANPFASLAADDAFDQAELPVATGSVRDGKVLLSLDKLPLIIEARRGRGRLTVLTFSPEREPLRSWKNRTWFWAKVVDLPPTWFTRPDFNRYGGMSIDGVIGAMIDSTQVRKLPVKWLLLLLVVYLVVIGPLDQYWLKRINKQMLTWLTFPAYVALFSGLIYFIGYKLRAGETEWNELHLVDVVPKGEQAELRGRTYASVYSPINAKYELVSDQPYATLRGEFQGPWAGGLESSRAIVEQRGNGFRGEIFIPVWTSQLFVSDWLQSANVPVSALVSLEGGNIRVTVDNHLGRKLNDVRLALQGKFYNLGELAANQSKQFTFDTGREGTVFRQFVDQARLQFINAIQSRRQALGQDVRLSKTFENAIAVSLVSRPEDFVQNNQFFLAPRGMDVSPLLDRGDAVLFAWAADHSVTSPIHRFTPRRTHRDTLLRLAIPVTVNN
jgi:hypothetical protein